MNKFKRETEIKIKTKGEQTMNKIQKIAAAVMMGTLVMLSGKLYAASTDTIQLRVTPSVVYSVQITSADANTFYNFGAVDLNYTTRTERSATVKNNGNIVSEWLVSAQVETPSNGWTLSTATGAANVAVLKALFNYQSGPTPVSSDYNTSNGSTITAASRSAEAGTGTQLSTTNASVQNIPVNGQRDLNFMLHTPVSASGADEQIFRVYVTAVAP